MEIQQRDVALSIILTIITCGIYGVYWFIVMSDDAKTASDDDTLPSGGMAFLLTLVTCGIYGIYWAYRMGKALAMARERFGLVATDNSVLYLILSIFGLNIINYALIQNDLNTIVRDGSQDGSFENEGDGESEE